MILLRRAEISCSTSLFSSQILQNHSVLPSSREYTSSVLPLETIQRTILNGLNTKRAACVADMEKYLQDLVITIPVLVISIGGILLMVCICWRSWARGLKRKAPRQSVNPQADCTQIEPGYFREKLIEEVMSRVKVLIADHFRKHQPTTTISREEFINLHQQKPLHYTSPTEASRDNRKRVDHVSFSEQAKVPAQEQILDTGIPKTDTFAALWVEELQRDTNGTASRKRKEKAQKAPTISEFVTPLSTPGQTVINCEPDARQDHLVYVSENGRDSKADIKSLQDLEMFLLTASANLCRSKMAFSSSYQAGKKIIPSGRTDIIPSLDLGRLKQLSRGASTSTSVPQLLKGGGPYGSEYANDFTWRFDIDEKEIESPPDTPRKKLRPVRHLCRGVNFQFEEHPKALSIIDLDPEQGYGWRGPDWQTDFGRYNVIDRKKKGPSIYAPTKPKSTSDDGVKQYYKWMENEAHRRLLSIQRRYDREKEQRKMKSEIHAEIEESKRWRENLTRYSSDSNSSTYESDPETHAQVKKKIKKDRVRSMLSSSSSSSTDEDFREGSKSKSPIATGCRRE